MKARPSNFEETRESLDALTSRGITGLTVKPMLLKGAIPPYLLPHVRRVHGSNAGVRKVLAKINSQKS